MYITFLIEDWSGKVLIEVIMEKYIKKYHRIPISYTILPYKGIGGIPKGNNALNNKSAQLLNDLPKRLSAFNISLKDIPNSVLFIILDNDNRNTVSFLQQLNQVSIQCNIGIDHVYCVAIEEMEAWLLGDRLAIQRAYPKLEDRIATKHASYRQDSICGTWEVLADMLTKQGLGRFKAQYPSPFDIGKMKAQWAKEIGSFMELDQNQSPSFNHFIHQLDKRRMNYNDSITNQ